MSLPAVSCVLKLAKTDSTQSTARFLAEQGAQDMTLVWAETQTDGRGRMKRVWSSEKGGLYISLILRPKFPPKRLAKLSLAAASAAAAAISKYAAVETFVKPPNDVYARAAFGASGGVKGRAKGAKKICGILAEASGDSRRVDWLVLGVGVNVNNAPRLRTACSLKSLTGKPWDIEAVLRSFLAEFKPAYERIR
ncbi:MAG TPA: biotin--[acetyl-CoA-carboxylase] ligase [Elusimicrobiota bacterium]|nr:biotin--[acetyl-CoA-carboxylase] ligase [Elusimicrobiota bacterium]